MSLSKQFNRKLDDLWHRRTAELRALVIPRPQGKLAGFSKRIREKHTVALLETATRILLRRKGRKEFSNVVDRKTTRFIKGHGLNSRYDHLIDWAKKTLPGPIVYSFWRGKKCLYVGKGLSWRRLTRYDKSAYLMLATRLTVFCIHGKSNLAKAECLATHLFEPWDEKMKPPKAKWGKACPVCKKHDRIRKELMALFRMK